MTVLNSSYVSFNDPWQILQVMTLIQACIPASSRQRQSNNYSTWKSCRFCEQLDPSLEPSEPNLLPATEIQLRMPWNLALVADTLTASTLDLHAQSPPPACTIDALALGLASQAVP
jgi:hypothetical protein